MPLVFALMLAAAPGGAMQIRSPAFGANSTIPAKYTCEGEDLSPPLEFEGVPPGTKALALVVDDPDAPDPAAPKTTWVHWVIYGMPAGTTTLPEGVGASASPAGGHAGLNDWKKAAWGGPCPPDGRHRYFFKLYALDSALPELGKPTKAGLEKAMHGHVLARAELVGTYQKR